MTMSEAERPVDAIGGTILQDPMEGCDEVIENILDAHQDPGVPREEDPFEDIYGLYNSVRKNSLDAFDDRFKTSAVYDALKLLLRSIGEECGYEHLMHYESKYGKQQVSDGIDRGVYWFKLYAGVLLETQPDITYEWGVSHFKEHRDMRVSHPETIQAPGSGPDAMYVSSIVPLWYVLEDILRLWRKTLDMSSEERDEREQVLKGNISPDGGLATYRYGFIQNINHRTGRPDEGYITDYQNGEGGKNSRFVAGEADFFPSVGDIVRFNAEQKTKNDGEPFNTLSVTEITRLE